MEQNVYLSTLVLYLVSMYLATMIALRGKDEFNLVIPYVRFSAQNAESSLVVVDTRSSSRLGALAQCLKNPGISVHIYDHHPKNESAWAHKGFSLRELGRYEEAIENFDKALEIDPETGHILGDAQLLAVRFPVQDRSHPDNLHYGRLYLDSDRPANRWLPGGQGGYGQSGGQPAAGISGVLTRGIYLSSISPRS